MSKINQLIKNVTKYPALGYPMQVTISGKVYWLGHVWVSQSEGIYTAPFEDLTIANDKAQELLLRMKGK